MSNHTPGPWKIDCLSYGQEGNWNPHHRKNIRIFAPDITSTGFILVNYIGPENNNIEQEANAKLIAAAPELLEALQACHDVLLMLPKHEMGRARLMAEKVINKIKE